MRIRFPQLLNAIIVSAIVAVGANGAAAPSTTPAPTPLAPPCRPTNDPATLSIRRQTGRCASLEVSDKSFDLVIEKTAQPSAASILDLLEKNAAALRMSSPRAELSLAPKNPASMADLELVQHAPGDRTLGVDTDMDCPDGAADKFSGRVLVWWSPDSLRVTFHIVERIGELLGRPRIDSVAARRIALAAAKDFGDVDPATVRARLRLLRRTCRGDGARLVYRVGIKDTYGRRAIDVDVQTGGLVATLWTDDPQDRLFGAMP